MAVVIQVDLKVCVLAVLVLVWVHRDNAVALRKELKEIKETLEDVLTAREKQNGILDKWGGIVCRVLSLMVYPIGTFCDLTLDIIDALKS